MIQLTDLYKKILREKKVINVSVDMTCGNGYDSLFLSKISNKVYAFDIQEKAITRAKEMVKEKSNITFICDDHQNILNHLNEMIDVAIYNLGYLPGGDKSLITTAESTIASLKSLLTILNPDGIIIIELYPHNKEEILKVSKFTLNLDNQYDVVKIDLLNKSNSPYLIVIKKALN